MTANTNKPIAWFEDDIVVYIDGIGELRAHHPRCNFLLCDDEAIVPHDEIIAYMVNDIVLSSVAADDYRFWVYNEKVYGRIDTQRLPAAYEDFIIFDTRQTVLAFADIHATFPLGDDVETFLRSVL